MEEPLLTECSLEDVAPPSALYETKETETKGLGMFAAVDIHPGTLILQEAPLMRIDHDNYTTADIAAAFAALPPASQEKYMSLHSVHGLCLDRPCDKFPVMSLLQLARQQHIDDAWRARTGDKATIASIFHANSMCAGDGGVICCEAARINHSCLPNAAFAWNAKQGVEEIRAVKEIKSGEEIFISYVSLFEPQGLRILGLKHHYGFCCTCQTCSDAGFKSGFAQKSVDRRFEIVELEERFCNPDGIRLGEPGIHWEDCKKLIKLIQEEGLVIPLLGIAFGMLSRHLSKFSMAVYARRASLSAVRVLTHCLGEDSDTTKREQEWLESLPA